MPTVDFNSLDETLRDTGTYVGRDITPAANAKELTISALVPDSDWSADVEDLYVSVEVSADQGETWQFYAGFGAGKGVPAGVPSAILPGAALRSKQIRVVLAVHKKMTVGVRIDTI
jgi:hypothetical protein